MKYDIAVYGLGVMGSSLAKNMINHGFRVAAYSKSGAEKEKFEKEIKPGTAVVCTNEREMITSLKSPRLVFLMITAGAPVDQVVEELTPMLEPGDVIFDGGNSWYEDTLRRVRLCKEKGIHFVGTGVSGGEKGALNGPSIMAGGSRVGYLAGEHILTSIAARGGVKPCCAWLGEGGAGHYVKMVHNGIEYAILELFGEAWQLLKEGLHMSREEILSCFEGWQDTGLNSYLLDISITVLKKDDEDGVPLVEKILDVAEQKGTGRWTVEEGLKLGVYLPTIYEAVMARSFSANRALRQKGSSKLYSSASPLKLNNPKEMLGKALLMGTILCYSQGMELLLRASEQYGFDIPMQSLADVWRDGCIIRSVLLDDIKIAAGEGEPLLLCGQFDYIKDLEPALRSIVSAAENSGLAASGFAGVLHYYDLYRTKEMPVRFIQALRDCFGAHTYYRNDAEGRFHTEWE